VRPHLREFSFQGSDPGAAYVETREVYFSSLGAMQEADCYDFTRLRPGNLLEGPAIVWSPITTVVINPGHSAKCDEYRNLVITWPYHGERSMGRGAADMAATSAEMS